MLDLNDWQNKKYTTRNGKPVRILCVDAIGEWPIIGTMIDEFHCDPREYPIVFDHEGKREHGYDDPNDLINAKTKREGWVNVFKLHERDYQTSGVFFSEEKADMQPVSAVWGADRIACIRIEWEE